MRKRLGRPPKWHAGPVEPAPHVDNELFARRLQRRFRKMVEGRWPWITAGIAYSETCQKRTVCDTVSQLCRGGVKSVDSAGTRMGRIWAFRVL